jgi:hypothetical protein
MYLLPDLPPVAFTTVEVAPCDHPALEILVPIEPVARVLTCDSNPPSIVGNDPITCCPQLKVDNSIIHRMLKKCKVFF